MNTVKQNIICYWEDLRELFVVMTEIALGKVTVTVGISRVISKVLPEMGEMQTVS